MPETNEKKAEFLLRHDATVAMARGRLVGCTACNGTGNNELEPTLCSWCFGTGNAAIQQLSEIALPLISNALGDLMENPIWTRLGRTVWYSEPAAWDDEGERDAWKRLFGEEMPRKPLLSFDGGDWTAQLHPGGRVYVHACDHQAIQIVDFQYIEAATKACADARLTLPALKDRAVQLAVDMASWVAGMLDAVDVVHRITRLRDLTNSFQRATKESR